MKGWTEAEIKNKNLMAPCGLYCGACGVYIATRDNNEKFKAIMGKLYGTKPDETECFGCMQPDPPKKLYCYCKDCKIRNCIKSKNYYSCHQCNDWPCSMIESFGLKTGLRVMKRTIPIWKDKLHISDIVDKIMVVYKEIKKNEQSPKKNYLLKGTDKSNLDKTRERIELMNKIQNTQLIL